LNKCIYNHGYQQRGPSWDKIVLDSSNQILKTTNYSSLSSCESSLNPIKTKQVTVNTCSIFGSYVTYVATNPDTSMIPTAMPTVVPTMLPIAISTSTTSNKDKENVYTTTWVIIMMVVGIVAICIGAFGPYYYYYYSVTHRPRFQTRTSLPEVKEDVNYELVVENISARI